MRIEQALLWCASRLAPADERAEWLAEWRAEAWHVRRSCSGRDAAVFCLGAFRDAVWLRRNREVISRRPLLDSPVRCLSLLAVLAAATALGALRWPAARAMLQPPPDGRRLVMVTPGGPTEIAAMSPAAYRWLAESECGRFAAVAFYRMVSGRPGISVAAASANLAAVLGAPIAGRGTLVLSDRAWRKYFHADPHIVGRTVPVGGQRVLVAAILPGAGWQLPGGAEAWLLDDDRATARGPGFVVARLAPSQTEIGNRKAVCGAYECISPWNPAQPLVAHSWILAVALLVVSTCTSFSLGEYGGGPSRRWWFLAAKIALLLPAVVCAAVDVAALFSPGVVAHCLFAGYVLALRWALVDQRRRCPVCLRRLTSPTRIGGASHAFLSWYGTELICARGHGLLHVPEFRTSSYWTQRWVYLDSSWRELFTRG
jgi:hypothetical protein